MNIFNSVLSVAFEKEHFSCVRMCSNGFEKKFPDNQNLKILISIFIWSMSIQGSIRANHLNKNGLQFENVYL